MKNLPEEYIAKDENNTREPCEIYDCWMDSGDGYWRYTSGDTSVIFENEEYVPAAIQRSAIKYDEGNRSFEMTLTAPFLSEPAIQYLGIHPVDIIWIHVRKIFRDQDPYQAQSIYIGTIKNIGFKGNLGQVTCTGFEHFLQKPIPKERAQPTCNVFPYTVKCGLNKVSYQEEFVVTSISSDGMIISEASLSGYDDDYFTWGWVESDMTSRLIVSHIGSNIYMRYPFSAETGDIVKVYPGCNGTIETCYSKFNNVVNFRGHPQVPVDNPVVWRGK